jgi:hypothetical protein
MDAGSRLATGPLVSPVEGPTSVPLPLAQAHAMTNAIEAATAGRARIGAR